MAEPSKAGNVCTGINLGELKGIQWHDDNNDGVPQVEEITRSGRAIADVALAQRTAVALQCYAELQKLVSPVKAKKTCQADLAAAKRALVEARKIARSIKYVGDMDVRRLLDLLEKVGRGE